jgi:crotonobetainyl-CoA:carnitine CoA-transferase CaiB-like acyl-CoA transferase
MKGLLSGLKVIDLSSVLAGPLTGSFLAECGARVLKVESPAGDVTNTWRAPGEPVDRTSAYYASANTGKEVHVADLKTAEGRSWLDHELSDADVLLQNMKWSDLERMGLMPDRLQSRFPHLVHVRLIGSEFDNDRLAYDVVIQAETGFMSMNGHPDRPPARMPVALMDILASHHMRAAVLGGLYRREKTGEGWYAEVSLLGAGLTSLANQGTNSLINGLTPRRQGSAHPNIAPYGDLLTCSDGEVVLAVGSDAQFEGLCRVLGCEALVDDPRFSTNPSRVEHREGLALSLNEAAKAWARDDLRSALHRARVPAGAVFSVMEALDQPGIRDAYVVAEGDLARLKTSAIQVQTNGSALGKPPH